MNKRIKKKRLLEIKLADCTTRVRALTSAVIEQNDTIVRQANEIAELRSTVERNAQATNSRFDYLEKKVAGKMSKKILVQPLIRRWSHVLTGRKDYQSFLKRKEFEI
ncbi:hypothetical protein [Streptococcus suis]|uniref:hypothetical protein n=1 Tax=Streptococcus suis TaxID=1307 RepID=UPI00209C03C5|nr:hypothetical protein [Streptococcus suis]MCO8179562.1 hypothetical protein [Streptococcus suis]